MNGFISHRLFFSYAEHKDVLKNWPVQKIRQIHMDGQRV